MAAAQNMQERRRRRMVLNKFDEDNQSQTLYKNERYI